MAARAAAWTYEAQPSCAAGFGAACNCPACLSQLWKRPSKKWAPKRPARSLSRAEAPLASCVRPFCPPRLQAPPGSRAAQVSRRSAVSGREFPNTHRFSGVVAYNSAFTYTPQTEGQCVLLASPTCEACMPRQSLPHDCARRSKAGSCTEGGGGGAWATACLRPRLRPYKAHCVMGNEWTTRALCPVLLNDLPTGRPNPKLPLRTEACDGNDGRLW